MEILVSLVTLSTTTISVIASTNESLLTTPVFIDIVLLPCPPGFTLTGYPHHCNCYPILSANSFKCSFTIKPGYNDMERYHVGKCNLNR